jgi:hypothetical protein
VRLPGSWHGGYQAYGLHSSRCRQGQGVRLSAATSRILISQANRQDQCEPHDAQQQRPQAELAAPHCRSFNRLIRHRLLQMPHKSTNFESF